MSDSILIIDDEPGLSLALRTRFKAAGFEVNHALNGLAGIEAAEMHRPAAIVLDIRMPDIDGFETCAAIHRIPGLHAVPVIFLSASVEDSARQRAIEVGGTEFLSKPFESADVIAAVVRAMEASARVPGADSHA